MRSGIPDTTNSTYHTNYIFDSLSEKFDGNTSTYTLTSAGSSDISGISTGNSVILINDILQGPGNTRDFTMGENLVLLLLPSLEPRLLRPQMQILQVFLLVVFSFRLVLLRVLDINH